MDLRAALQHQEAFKLDANNVHKLIDCQIMSRYFGFLSTVKNHILTGTLPNVLEFDRLGLRYSDRLGKDRRKGQWIDWWDHSVNIFSYHDNFNVHAIDKNWQRIEFSNVCTEYADKLSSLLQNQLVNFKVVGELGYKQVGGKRGNPSGQYNWCEINVIVVPPTN